MLIVGLTGNIASGKSTVARRFASHGARIIDADALAREAVAAGSPALAAIVERWGPAMLDAHEALDRNALRRIVFRDPAQRAALDAIVHPAVARRRQVLLAEARTRGDRVVVADIPLLFEVGLTGDVDTIVLVDSPLDVRRARLVNDRGLDAAEADAMIAAQMPAQFKRERADQFIENAGTIDDLSVRADQVWEALSSDPRARPESP